MDLKALGANLGLDESEFIELVELFLTTADNDLQRIEAAGRAGDPQAIADAAHSLKGASGNLGFSELSAASKAVEDMGRTEQIDGLDQMVATIRTHIEKVRACLD